MSMSIDSKRQSAEDPKGARRRWVQMELRPCGRLDEVIQGGGKTGATGDSDPQSTTKGGVG